MNNLHNKITHNTIIDMEDKNIDRWLEFGIQMYFSRPTAGDFFKNLSRFIWAPIEDEMRKEYEAIEE